MLETDCQGTWRDYHGPLETDLPEGKWLMRCDGCGEVKMFTTTTAITLIPGA